MKSQDKYREYSEDYKRICFQSWYNGGRPNSTAETLELIPEDKFGRKPHYSMISKWMKEFMWNERADELDAKSIILSDEVLIVQKANMLQRQAEHALLLQDKARHHLLSGTFDSSSAAVNAYFRATEEERLTRGIGDMIVKMAKMNDSDLMDEISKRISRASESGQIIDATPIEDKKENILEEDDMTP